MKIKEIDKNDFLQRLEIIAEKYEPQKDEYFYKNIYSYFVDYFKNINKIEIDHFII